jgi:hypothetical protein
MFAINGIVKWIGTINLAHQTEKFALPRGEHVLSWKFRHETDSTAQAKLHNVVITGSIEGGAAACLQCPVGHKSHEGSISCESCPIGQTSTSNNTDCQPCTNNTYNDWLGNTEGCMDCPEQTRAN